MIIFLFLVFLMNVECFTYNNWNKNSWQKKKISQNIEYSNKVELDGVIHELENKSPLIFSGEAEDLKKELIDVSNRNGFILMGGDCAETFREYSVNSIIDNYNIFLQMTLILMYGSGMPVVKIGRMAGQFAKPRSNIKEVIDGYSLNSYRGDIINQENFDEKSREYDPKLMIKAYHQSVQTMNLLRALSEGGYADIRRIDKWNLNFVKENKYGKKYEDFAKQVNKAIKFMESARITNFDSIKKAKMYTGHEALLLNYESALTRKDQISGKYYGCSGHLLWVGERTRDLDGAHIEYLRGIENPVGIKISHKFDENEILKILRLLNPNNDLGKIVIITRMGEEIQNHLPRLVKMIQRYKMNVIWMSDPMHGNTKTYKNKYKTRYLDDIKKEFKFFFDYLKENNEHPGGIHLEMTGKDVTECLTDHNDKTEFTNFQSSCDPRLSASQCLDLSFYISSLF